MIMNITNIEHTRWDTFSRTLQFNDTDWVAINLTWSTIKMTLKHNFNDTDFITQSTAMLTVPLEGTATIEITWTELNLENWNYYYDIEWTDSIWTIVTFLKWFFIISFDVTN